MALLIEHVRLLPDPDGVFVDDGFLLCAHGRVLALGPRSAMDTELLARLSPARWHGRGGVLLPGLINGHCHAAMTLFRGLADDMALMQWLEDHIFPAEARWVREEMVYWCSALAALEMAAAGVTTVVDAYFHARAAARGFSAVGLRSLVAQGITDFPVPGVPDPGQAIPAAAAVVEALADDPLASGYVFAHSVYTCRPETLCRARRLARTLGVPFAMHLAETREETASILDPRGATPLRHVEALDILDQDTVLVHAVHLDRDECRRLAGHGAKVVLCPRSNLKLAAGSPPAAGYHALGVPVALGTDGPASNNTLRPFAEMACLLQCERLRTGDPEPLPRRALLAWGCRGGVEVWGRTAGPGRLYPGAPADCIVLEPFQAGPERLADTIAQRAASLRVALTVVAGEIVYDRGAYPRIDAGEVLRQVRSLARRVQPR